MTENALWEKTAALLTIAVLVGGCVLIIVPFTSALLWAAIMALTTWNLFRKLGNALGNRQVLAAFVLVGIALAVIVLPLIYALIISAEQIHAFYLAVHAKIQHGLPDLPRWLANLPLLGHRLEAFWDGLIAGDVDVRQRARELLMRLLNVLLTIGGVAGQGFGVLLLSCFFLLFFYIGGERGCFWLESTLFHIGGVQAVKLLGVAASTIKSVVFGIIGTAVVQGVLGAIGFAVAGVPMVLALGLGTALLSLVPGGPALLWIPAAIWLHHQGESGWAIFTVAWGTLVVGTADNIVRPLLIGKGTQLPLLLIMLGVLGGALNFGLLGVFIGPTFLAVGFAVLRDWVQTRSTSTGVRNADI